MLEPVAAGAALAFVGGGAHFRMEHILGLARGQVVGAHAAAPFSTWAMWMYFSGTPRRSAQPF